jgi:hypothetical protein
LGKHYRRPLHSRMFLLHLASAHQSSIPSTEEEHDDAFDRENKVRGNDQNISSGVNNDQAEEEPVWELSSGELQNKQTAPAPLERNPQLEWDFRIGKNGTIEHPDWRRPRGSPGERGQNPYSGQGSRCHGACPGARS